MMINIHIAASDLNKEIKLIREIIIKIIMINNIIPDNTNVVDQEENCKKIITIKMIKEKILNLGSR